MPFALVGAATVAVFISVNWPTLDPAEVIGILGGGLGLALAWALLPWDRLPHAAQSLLPMGSVALIVGMQVLVAPRDIDPAALMLLPVLWSALYSTAREAAAVTVLAVSCVLGMQVTEEVFGSSIGLTGWTEATAMVGGLVLLTWFTVRARTHARTDSLTGIANRRAWDDVLGLEIERVRRDPGPLAVALIDLDNFKRFNDAFGHPQGDRHLAESAAAWARCLRGNDHLARVGGEEFAVLLVGADRATARAVLQRLACATPNEQTCSIGVAQWDGREDAAALMARADDALYAAKAAGRDRIVIAHRATNDAGPPMGGPVIGTEARAA